MKMIKSLHACIYFLGVGIISLSTLNAECDQDCGIAATDLFNICPEGTQIRQYRTFNGPFVHNNVTCVYCNVKDNLQIVDYLHGILECQNCHSLISMDDVVILD